jgi:outer membrane protein assembly factor BamB
VAWRGGTDDSSYSSPFLIDVGAEDGAVAGPVGSPQRQLVVFASTRILGLDPDSGKELWSHPHLTRSAFNISTPLWSPRDGILFMSSAYDGGGRAIQLTRGKGGATAVKELWFSNQVRVHFGTAIRIDDTVYCSSGDFGPAPITAVDLRTGEVLWRDRTFAKNSLLRADGKVILLDEDGALGLIDVDRQGMKVRSRTQLFKSLSWTVPTIVGTRLYARDREEIVAVDLAP